MFLRKYEEKQLFLWKQHFDRRYVCNPAVQQCQNISVVNCVGYDKLWFREYYVVG